MYNLQQEYVDKVIAHFQMSATQIQQTQAIADQWMANKYKGFWGVNSCIQTFVNELRSKGIIQ